MSGVLIIGAGGHGKVVADILQSCGKEILGFLDDNPRAWGRQWFGFEVLGAIDEYPRYDPGGLILGIGLNHVRQTIAERLGTAAQHLWLNAIHPRATISASTQLGVGAVVAAHAVINPDTSMGSHVIINTGSTIDHDCEIGDFVHIAPGSHLAGGVRVREGAFLGVGTAIIPSVTVGEWSTVGAGSVVLRDVPARVTAYGAPARVIKPS